MQVKSLNTRVVAFLQQSSVIAQLLDYIVVLPADSAPPVRAESVFPVLMPACSGAPPPRS